MKDAITSSSAARVVFGHCTFSIGLGGTVDACLGGRLFAITPSDETPFWLLLAGLIGSMFIAWSSGRVVNYQHAMERK